MTLHQPNDIIAQRYRIVTSLGKGGMGITYEAEDLINYQRVALKVVSLRQAKDWKILELFEREARVIANLHHPQIPKYLNYFYIDTKQDRRFYLIRELVSGNSLATWVEQGWHPTELQVKQVAIQILEILIYLHQLNPPIIHRDIKPENVILQPDGKIFLVDFGAVKDIYRNTIYLSRTFVGTIGYMPPEQLKGKANCTSDLYSLGGTLLYLLTHRFPDELPQKRMKIDVRSCVKISPKFANWLEVILEPMWEDRFKSAREALNLLSNKSKIVYDDYYGVQSSHTKPVGSRVTLEKTSTSLIINIPSVPYQDNILPLFFYIIIVLFILFISRSLIVSFFLVILYFFTDDFLSLFSKIQIQIDKNEFFIHWKFLVYSHKNRGKTADIYKIELDYGDIYYELDDKEYRIIKSCSLFVDAEIGVKNYKFGGFLQSVENEWLVAEIRDFLEELKTQESLKKTE
ncbi:serine/threonine protein kinase [Dapis sp. BLCC M172]|uniref:serine/threonine protein kinase n=1 Tax=Dapis sp. BLCC M172 TaxID=2975281 RepID=UPI003CE87C40